MHRPTDRNKEEGKGRGGRGRVWRNTPKSCLKTQVRNPGSVCFCSALTLTANERGSQTPGHSLPEDDDRSALLDVLRPDAVGDFISSISTEKKQHVSMDGQPKIPGVRGQK